jgi:Undecaprenyl-phosphate glucose phosphotransferase
VLLAGYSRAAESYIDRLLAHPEWGYSIHGILDNYKPLGYSYRDIHVIGRIEELENVLGENDYDELAITLSISHYDALEGIVTVTEKSGIHTKFIPDYNNIIPTRPYTEDLDGLPIIHVRNVPLTNSFNRFIKRTIDIIGSLGLILLFSIPMLVIAAIIKITSPGPLIFKQERVGLHNRPFKMYKFRSMEVQDSSKEKHAWTVENDPRVTPIGKFIRKTSLDELPQFFNVLMGDMSLVGPRPERPFFVEKFKEEIPRYMVKHQVRPGITGWAQVNGYRGDTSIRMRIDCDLYYIENWTIGLDIKILFLTIFKGFVNKNAY